MNSARGLSRLIGGLSAGLLLWLICLPAGATSSTIVVSQVYGGGGNSGATFRQDFIELFNRGATTVDVTGWSVQYASATGTTWQVTALSGSIPPGGYYLVQEAQGAGGTVDIPTPDAMGTIAMSATAGKVALVNNVTALTGSGCPFAASVVDFVGYGGTANCFEGIAPTPAPSNTTAVLRGAGGCTETDENSTDFSAGAPNPRNSASPAAPCSGLTNPSGIGAADPNAAGVGETTLLTVAVTPGSNPTSTGLMVSGDLTSIGGSATQPFFDDGTNGDVLAGDNTFSYTAMVALGTSPGPKSLPITITDAQARSGSTAIAFLVQSPLIAINDIQGNGAVSPLAGQFVTTSGVVTGVKSNGFFIQTPDGSSDDDLDPNSSEGIFVFTSAAPPPAATAGNLVEVSGTVQEFIPSADPGSLPLTEIAMPTVTSTSTGNPLPAAITLTTADTDPLGSIEQLERFEGMRVRVDSLTVVGPTQGGVVETTATATSNGVFYGTITGISRPFREPGVEIPDPLPPGSPCCVPRFDANPERLRVDSDGLVGASAIEVTTGATVTGLVGPLDFGFRTYTVLPDPGSSPGVSGNLAATPVPIPAAGEFTIASFNLNRFFDDVNDPGIGEPVLTPAAFANRLTKASLAIRNVLRSPDIIGVQEAEHVAGLQVLANRVNADTVAASLPDPQYQAYVIEGIDPGGIDVGFLVKRSRVDVFSVTQEGASATFINPLTGMPELLNDRPPLVLLAGIHVPGSTATSPVTVIVNHLRSLIGVDDPVDGPRVRAKRRAQAEFLANLIQARKTGDPSERIVSVGDYNAFQFNDGYVDSIGTIRGVPTPPSEVVLASGDLVNPDLVNLIDAVAPPSERYSFVFDGNAQALDHILISPNLLPLVQDFAFARNGADFPETYRNDPFRPERLSDHDMPVAYFGFAATAVVSGDTTICAGKGSAIIQADLTGTPPWSVTWSDGFTQTGILTSPTARTVSPAVTTTYTITSVSDAVSAGTASGSAVITVNPLPSAMISAPAEVCAGSGGHVASVPDAGPGATYLWTIGNGVITAGAGTRMITFTATGPGALALGVVVRAATLCQANGVAAVTVNAGCTFFYTVTPCRVADTRGLGFSGPQGPPALAASASRNFPAAGQCGIPSSARAVVLNVTVTEPTAPGNLTLFPSDIPAPATSTLNYSAGQTRANNAIVRLGADGGVGVFCSQASGTAQVIIDVTGYFE